MPCPRPRSDIPMRIGIDATCWANGRGYGRFVRHLLPALADVAAGDDLVCFLDPKSAASFDLAMPNVRAVVVPQTVAPTEAAGSSSNRGLADMFRLSRAVWREHPRVFFFPTVYTYFPLPPSQRSVVTVHDAIAERFPDLTLPTARARLFWKLKVKLALAQARLVLTVSDFAAGEIESVIGVAPDRIRVAPEAAADTFRPTEDRALIDQTARRYGLDPASSWVIYVGGFNPHKRLDAIIAAHAAVCQSRPNRAPDLVLVGTLTGDVFHQEVDRLRSMVERLGTGARVRWTGFVPDEDLRHLHSGALALLLPSSSEGFGLPAVEAAACGTPVIATTESPLPVLLESGGFFVAPRDEAGITTAMITLLDDAGLRQRMGRRARDRAGALSWRHCADQTLKALQEAAA